MTFHDQRKLVRQMVDEASVADAPTAYYALFHDPARSALFIRQDETGQMLGFVGRFQTGIDLFRPLVTLGCRDAESAAELLAQALESERAYIFFAAERQFALVGGNLQINQQRKLSIYRLDVRQFQPEINVLVQHRTAYDGTPRCVIKSEEGQALAGINWQSPAFAEIFVQTDAAVRQRHWGQHVVTAITQAVLASGRVPLYLVEQDNAASRALAEKLGYVDSGAGQVYAEGVYLGHPGG